MYEDIFRMGGEQAEGMNIAAQNRRESEIARIKKDYEAGQKAAERILYLESKLAELGRLEE